MSVPKILIRFPERRFSLIVFSMPMKEENMKKLAYAFAALATIAIATSTIASAEEFGIRVGGDRDIYRERGFRGARAEFAYGEHDRGLHRGWYRGYHRGQDRTVIIKQRHRHWEN
jgi:hypothetical protein